MDYTDFIRFLTNNEYRQRCLILLTVFSVWILSYGVLRMALYQKWKPWMEKITFKDIYHLKLMSCMVFKFWGLFPLERHVSYTTQVDYANFDIFNKIWIIGNNIYSCSQYFLFGFYPTKYWECLCTRNESHEWKNCILKQTI